MKYQFSVYAGKEAHEVSHANAEPTLTLGEFADKILCAFAWSPATFKDHHRSNESLEQIQLMTVDIDDGLTLTDALAILEAQGFQAIVATTRNHRKEKKTGNRVKPPCDRFRIIIPLERPITDDATFKATWYEMNKLFPTADKACKDAARFFYPCTEVFAKLEGKAFPVTEARSDSALNAQQQAWGRTEKKGEGSPSQAAQNPRGELSRATKDFIVSGPPPGEDWHPNFFKATIDLKQQGYTKEEASEILRKATLQFEGNLDKKDLEQIDDIYNNREPKHPPRFKKTPHATPNSGVPRMDTSKWTYKRQTEAERVAQFDEDKKIRELAVKTAVPFICTAFDGIYELANGLNLIGGVSGQGKSTVVANILANCLIKCPGRQIVVVSNEERSQDVAERVACILLRKSWRDHRRPDSPMPPEDRALIEKTAKSIFKNIEVVSDKETDTTSIEFVHSVLQDIAAKQGEISLLVIDYHQTINTSRIDPSMGSVEVSKRLGDMLRIFTRKVAIPIALFTQLKPNSDNLMFSDRVQNDRTIYNHATAVIEIIPDPERLETTFHIHKDRFNGNHGKKVVCNYVDGRFEPKSSDLIRQLVGSQPKEQPESAENSAAPDTVAERTDEKKTRKSS